jgi:hypothetical protein
MTKSLIRGNKGEQGGKRQGQLLDKTWEVVTTVPSKDEGSTEEEEDNIESNEGKVEIADSVITGSSDLVVSSPDDDHQGDIESAIGGFDAQCKACIGSGSDVLLSLIPHNCFVYSPRECRDTKLVVLHFKSVVSSWERVRRTIGSSRYL